MLAYPHIWVRLAAAQSIGFILAAIDVEKVTELLNDPEESQAQEEERYMYSKPSDTLRSLVLDLVAQLHPDMMFEALADQVVKNLIFIAKMLKSIARSDEQDNESKLKNSNNLSLPWLIRRLRRAVNIEITQAPKSVSVVRVYSVSSFFVYVKIPVSKNSYNYATLLQRYVRICNIVKYVAVYSF